MAEAGIGHRALAASSGVAHTTIGRILAGTVLCDIGTLARLEHALGRRLWARVCRAGCAGLSLPRRHRLTIVCRVAHRADLRCGSANRRGRSTGHGLGRRWSANSYVPLARQSSADLKGSRFGTADNGADTTCRQ
jgi:hypothetical protein